MKYLGADLFQNIVAFFQSARESISLEYLLYIFVGIEILTIIVFCFIVHNVYELKLIRAVDKINAYLYEVQYINENNLIEFNNMMKRVPKTLRYHWQQYMLNRDKNPSYYMSVENCIDRPLKTSTFSTTIKTFKYLGFVYAILSFIISCGWATGLASVAPDYFILVFAIPLVILLLTYLFILVLNIRKTSNANELYQTFQIFNRFIDKAVSTMPDYVDFEVLFTAQEIQRGIPVLNEYIEKRQLQEQEEMKRARENAIQHEQYNFESAGEKGELVLERAMKETELFVSLRSRLEAEIQQLEGEIESLKRNFDNTTKDYQKKLQASKENSERLREQQEATTNRIENNYIRKQQADEIRKQEQIEKDQEDAQLRFNQEINNLATEIQKRKEELQEAKVNVEKSMLSEYKTFANKIYKEIRDTVNEQVKEERDELISSREEVARELEDTLAKLDKIEKENKILANKAEVRDEKNKPDFEVKNKSQEKLDAEIDNNKNKKIEVTVEANAEKQTNKPNDGKPVTSDGAYDSNGNYRYKNGAYFDKDGNFHDKNGNVFDVDGRKIELFEDEKVDEIKQPTPVIFGENSFDAFDNEPKKEDKIEFNDFFEDEMFGEDDSFINIKPAGKRGRPKKETTANVTKKAVGRPKKNVSAETKVKKPVGRPKKTVQKNDLDENLRSIENRLREQNELLKQQQKALDLTIKNVIRPKN